LESWIGKHASSCLWNYGNFGHRYVWVKAEG
jgi:hypothetical protein